MTKPPSQRLGQAVDAQGHQHTLRFHGEGENAATITRSPEATDTLQMQVADHLPAIVDTRWRRFVRAGS